jgi:two-component system, response regulator / RNA-binding antiterminator
LLPEGEDLLAQQELIERSNTLRIGLLESGFNLVATLPPDVFLAERIDQLQPDLIIVDAESDARDALEHVVFATREERRPIVMFTDDEDTSFVGDAFSKGVCAYVVSGMEHHRIRPILEVALARFKHEESLRKELSLAKEALESKNVLERAKALIMQKHRLSEPEAYAKMRKIAMNRGLKITQLAQNIVDIEELFL